MKKQNLTKKTVYEEKNVALKVEHLFCVYNESNEGQKVVLCDNNLTLQKNKIHYIIGSSGCGKTTLVNHFNGLLKAKYGNVLVQNNYPIGCNFFIHNLFIGVVNLTHNEKKEYFVANKKINKPKNIVVAFKRKISKHLVKILFEAYYKIPVEKVFKLRNKLKQPVSFYLLQLNDSEYDLNILDFINYSDAINCDFSDVLTKQEMLKKQNLSKHKIKKIKQLKKTVGIVFQFPEYQLFKDTILKDVTFGPITLGMNKEEAEEKAIEHLNALGINNSFLMRNPFDLSGGQKRRIAIAGILAFDPDILVFDEPTAGLDPDGEREILNLIVNAKNNGKTVVVISHNMDHVLEVSDNIIVMHDGEIIAIDHAYNIFTNNDIVKLTSIDKPQIIHLIEQMVKINPKFKKLYELQPKTVNELAYAIKKVNKL